MSKSKMTQEEIRLLVVTVANSLSERTKKGIEISDAEISGYHKLLMQVKSN